MQRSLRHLAVGLQFWVMHSLIFLIPLPDLPLLMHATLTQTYLTLLSIRCGSKSMFFNCPTACIHCGYAVLASHGHVELEQILERSPSSHFLAP